MSDRPGVTIVIPVLNASSLLPRCLGSIRDQDYPRALVQVLVADGGSTDGTRELAESYGAEVVDNPERLAEPGVALGMSLAKNPIRIVMAADNDFPTARWLSTVASVFESSKVRGVYTHVVNASDDPPFSRYFNLLHADPFNWFVFGRGADPKRFGRFFPVVESGDGYVVYEFPRDERPLLAMAQGFALRGELPRGEHNVEDDILPLWEALDRGERFAYTTVGIHHHHTVSLRQFLRKYRARTASVLRSSAGGWRARERQMTPGQRRRRALWLPYSLSLVLPLVDAIRGLIRDRDRVWLYHPIACAALSGAMALGALDARRSPAALPPRRAADSPR
jgi:glycosyltransferase involved in cell wall biosynthesis